jgi:putative DNA primase/helicase
VSAWAPSKAFERVINALEAAGSRGEGGGRQWRYTCPSHDDHRPSLSITDGEERVLIWCHSPQCDTDSVLEKLGLSRADLFDNPHQAERAARHVVAEYPYVDAQGTLLFVKVRYVPKSFALKRPDGTGGWAWGLAPDTPRVLYRLPRVLAADPSDVIWIVEGERDVHSLEAVGEIATCNHDGASGGGERPKWRADYCPVFVGRDVLVVADRDEDGHTHAEYVANCLDGIGRSVWIVEAAQGKDATDHLAAGLAVTDFRWWS